jgi:hypothetical protein
MMAKKFTALICGYGVPKDIFTDLHYNAYLRQVVNELFDRYKTSGTIVLNGGRTDLFKPYRRTEAGEMARWFTRNAPRPWKIVAKPKSLTTVENLLNVSAEARTKNEMLSFCEYTRAPRIRRLIREIPKLRRAKVIAIDFDGSPRRYEPMRTRQSEKEFLQLELAALRDQKSLAHLRQFAKKKLAIMRQYSPEEAHRRLPQILEQLHAEYRSKQT